MRQLFEVGEIVVRQAPSKNYPEQNGEYTVLGVITDKEMKEKYPTMAVNITGGLYYELEGLEIKLPKSGSISRHSSQEYLKKKHDKGDMSYTSLMNSLKNPVLEWK